MRRPTAAIRDFFRSPVLPRESRSTYRYHLAFALLDAAAGGVLANAPVVALKVLMAPDWQLGLNLSLSGVGMLFTLYLGSWMASRPKMPFVFIPGVAGAVITTGMVLTENSLLFLTLGGVGLMFNTISRPAVTAVIRCNYPPTHRGLATGEIRKWSSLVFLVVFIISAAELDLVAAEPMAVVRLQLVLAGLMSVASFLCFRHIRVREDLGDAKVDLRPQVIQSFREAGDVLRADGRFRRYLVSGFLFGFSGLAYVAYIPAFLDRDLHYSYKQCAMLLHVIPLTASFLATGILGRWIDRSNLWWSWAWIRFGWGLDPLLLAATPACAAVVPAAGAAMPVAGRISRGSVMGGSWILWWQIGVGHFARPGGDTSRYQGILIFVNGLMRMTAPAAGAWLLAQAGCSRPMLFLIGGLGVMLSGLHSLWEARRERGIRGLATIADFEEQFRGPGDEGPAAGVGE